MDSEAQTQAGLKISGQNERRGEERRGNERKREERRGGVCLAEHLVTDQMTPMKLE